MFGKNIKSWLAGNKDSLDLGFSKSFPLALIILDKKLRVVNFTDKWKSDFHLADVDDADIVNKVIDDMLIVLPLFQPERMRIIRHALTGEGSHHTHDLFQYDEKHFDWVTWSVKPWRDSNNKIKGVIVASETTTRSDQLEKYYNLAIYMLCTASVKGYFLEVNPAFIGVLGYSKECLLERSFYDFIHPDDIENTAAAIGLLATQNKVQILENRFRCQDGSYIYLEWSILKESDSDIFYAIARDVSNRKSQQKMIEESNELLDNLVYIQEMYIKGINAKQLFSEILKKVLQLTKSKRGFIAALNTGEDGKSFLTLLSISEMNWDESVNKFYAQYSSSYLEIHDLDNVLGRTLKQREIVIINEKDEHAEIFPIGFEAKTYLGFPIYGSDNVVGMFGVMDLEAGYSESIANYISPLARVVGAIVESHENVLALQHMAHVDKLTGLSSRPYFEGKLKKVFEEKQRRKNKFALIAFDLNRFKAINDTYGHLTGDLLLEKVGARILSAMQQADIAGRVGGDEFAIIVTESERVDDVLRIANRLKHVLIRPYDIQGIQLEVGVSIGIAVYSGGGGRTLLLCKSTQIMRCMKQRKNQQIFKFILKMLKRFIMNDY